MNTLDLSGFFQTKAQATDFSSRVASLSEKIYETNFDLEKAALEEFGLKKKDIFMKLLLEQKVAIDSHTALKQFLTELQGKVNSFPVMTITLAFEPKEPTMRALSEWFVMNINQQVLFDVNVDPRLIAGASISYKGKNGDYSIRPKVHDIIEKQITKQPSGAKTV